MGVLFIFLLYLGISFIGVNSDVLCESGYCRNFLFDPGCSAPADHCSVNNATYFGLTLPSPTTCNCCPYCLPIYTEKQHCSLGGPGAGSTVGRCGDGLTCQTEGDDSVCKRMESKCHSAQDDYDARHAAGLVGALEFRPHCDGKGLHAAYDCVPTQTCFCQSEDGERLFGETLYLGTVTTQNMHCGCSRLQEQIKKDIAPFVSYPVLTPRCTSDGNFNPVQCMGRTCYCVDRVTGRLLSDSVNLEEESISELSCYDATLDLFPTQSTGEPPYNYTSPCLEAQQEYIQLLSESAAAGFNVDFFSDIPECLPDATAGRIAERNGSKICIDERGQQIGEYEAKSGTDGYEDMDCKCAQTSLVMGSAVELPVCCKNGNFRKIQCRRGQCRCVDSDGRQVGAEASNVEELSCYTSDWLTC